MSAYLTSRASHNQRWEQMYDLHSKIGIEAIPNDPPIKPGAGSSIPPATAQLEYYIFHLAGLYEKNGDYELAEACYKKAYHILPHSIIKYDRNIYMRYPRFLFKIRKFEQAKAIKHEVDKLFPTDTGGVYLMPKDQFIRQLTSCGHSKPSAEELYQLQLSRVSKAREALLVEDDWEWAWEHLPEYTPKSSATYASWRYNNNSKYQKLKSEAERLGKILL